MKKTTLRNYARLIARKGVNIKKGQEVFISAALDQPEFITILAEECYRAGAGKVSVEWNHPPIGRLEFRNRTLKSLTTFEKWEIEKMNHKGDALPAMITILSSAPDGAKGLDQKKIAAVMQAQFSIAKPVNDKIQGHCQWCAAAVPGKEWAKKVFPGERTSTAVNKLWKAILSAARADGEDPILDWENHNKDLHKRCDHLNSLGIEELIYKSSCGTDFTVGLMPQSIFAGGTGETSSGVTYNPNIPSEEVFTSPMRGKAEGVVYSSMPLSYQGKLIENFSIKFKDGKAFEVHAEKGEDLLRQMISMDEGAAYLGECALVPFDSPIKNSGLIFYNTLFDENACCHLALGRGFPDCIKDHEKYSLEEMHKMGLNDSMTHVDFMIGTSDLSITAKTRDGKLVPIFKDGNWAF